MLRPVLVFLPILALFLMLPGCPPPAVVTPSLAWAYAADDGAVWGLTIGDTLDGGFVIGGGHTGYNMYSLKLNGLGGFAWDHIYSNMTTVGSPTELWRNEARGLIQTGDGGYIMLGSGNNASDGLPSAGYLLVKLDADGNVAWSKTYAPGNPYSDGDYCVNNRPAALALTSDGGYFAAGDSYVGIYNIASVLKTDAEGNVEFLKVINDNERAYNQNILAAQQTADGGYVLSGYSDDGSPYGHLALLIKLDADGDLEFSRTYQYPAENHGAESYAIAQTADGGYVIGGELINNIGKVSTYGCWIARTDANGDLVWSHAYGHADTVHYPNALAVTPEGDILAVGANNTGAMALAKFAGDGTLLWNFVMPEEFPSITGNAMTLTADGACVVVGSGNGGTTVVAKVDNVFSVD